MLCIIGPSVVATHPHFSLPRSARIGRRDIVKEKDMKKKVEVTPQPPRRRSSSGAGGEESSDQYGLSQLFQPDNVPKGAHPEGEDNTTVRTKFKVAALKMLLYDKYCVREGRGLCYYYCFNFSDEIVLFTVIF